MKRIIKTGMIVFLLIMVIGIAACGNKESDQESAVVHASSDELVGKWKGTGNEISTLTLGSNGSYKDIAGELSVIGTYTVDEISGTLTVNEKDYGLVFPYRYELDGDNLTLQMDGGLPRTFARQ